MPKSKKRTPVPQPSVDDIIRYEQDEMSQGEVVNFFQGMIDSGLAWQFQGHYGRTAAALIEHGYCAGDSSVVDSKRGDRRGGRTR
jgi:hypothetical protein